MSTLICRTASSTVLPSPGIATNVCCETTAREAMVRDFRVFFLSDGTTSFDIGDVSAAELQRATCATLGFIFAQVLTVDEMIRK
ncbi:MAG: isochorismatase family protein, partial [Verrucomicrobia bacterium]|nr:isochorismatase family protein [Verrucomicrobiota bacterium]